MTEDRRARIWDLFDRAADLAPAAQQSLLREACPDDAGLRAEVEKLLADDALLRSGQNRPDFLCSPVVQLPPAPPAERPVQVGPYRIVRLIGEGGMGAVYEAEQDNPRRPVALKMIRSGLASPGLVKRFTREAHVLGRLHHPGIAQVFAAGVTDGGRPYFAMEFIRGVPLDTHVHSHHLDTAARLNLAARICDAVQHAHDHGVIHRDLKPANVLVDETGQPKVLDFGVARATDADLLTTAGTEVGQLVGTLAYMSPEQVAGNSAALDTRSDVYALGVVIFQLLADRLPYRLQGLPLPEAARVIRDRDPDRLGSADTTLRGDVETIIAKALEKDGARRYASAGALAADIRHYLAGEPIAARPASAWYQFRKFARRNKAAVAGVATTIAALVAGLAFSLTFAVREAAQRRVADDERRQALAQTYQARLAAAVSALRDFQPAEAERQLRDAPEDLRGWEWQHLHSQVDDSLTVIRGLSDAPDSAGFDPALTRVVGLRDDAVAGQASARPHLWDAITGRPEGFLGEPTNGSLHVAPIAGGAQVWWESGDHKSWLVHVVPAGPTAAGADPGRKVDRAPHTYGETLAVSPGAPGGAGSGTRFAASARGTPNDVEVAALFDAATGRQTAALGGITNHVGGFAFSPDGRLVAGACDDATARLWDAATGTPVAVFRGYKDKVSSLAFSPDGGRLLTAAGDGTFWLWDVATRRLLYGPVRGHVGDVRRVAFSPDGTRFASGGTDATVRLWRTEDGEALGAFLGHAGSVWSVAFRPDGRRLGSIATDGTARVWDSTPRAEVCVLRGHTGYVYPVAYSPDGRLLASGGWDNVVRLWDAATGRPVGQPLSAGPVFTVAISPNGECLAAGGHKDGEIRLWDLATGRPREPLRGHTARVRRVAFSPDGRRLASVAEDRTVRIWDVASGAELYREHVADSPHGWLPELGSVCYSPDGRLVATPGGRPEDISVRDADSFAVLATLRGHTKEVCSVAFSPDGGRLVTAGRDGTVRVWDAVSGREVRTLGRHSGEAFCAVFSPDGSRIASGGRDRSIRLWDPATGEELVRLPGHASYIYGLAFSPDGRTLASGSGDCTVRLWDTFPLSQRLKARDQDVDNHREPAQAPGRPRG